MWTEIVTKALTILFSISDAGLIGAAEPFKSPLSAIPGEFKFSTELYILQVLHDDAQETRDGNVFEVSLRQIVQQVLPDAYNKTPIWAYGNPGDDESFRHPSGSIEVTRNNPTKVKWINELVVDPVACRGNWTSDACNYIPHIIQDIHGNSEVNQALTWAAPNMVCADGKNSTDCRGKAGIYEGPVPMVTHVHGAHVKHESDGHPEGWFLPRASNLPKRYAKQGTYYHSFLERDNKQRSDLRLSRTRAKESYPADDGFSIYEYRNDQQETALWYHDHTLGLTKMNTYAGGGGFYFIRGDKDNDARLSKYDCHGETQLLPGPPARFGEDSNANDSGRRNIREIGLIFEFKSFYDDGSLMSARNGNVAVVNGNAWPVLTVAPERYRFRLLNADPAVSLNLALIVGENEDELPFFVIGSDHGFLTQVVEISTGFAASLTPCGMSEHADVFDKQGLRVTSGERYDVIVDFSGLPEGKKITLINREIQYRIGASPLWIDTTEVMQFSVSHELSRQLGDPSTSPYDLALEPFARLQSPHRTRHLTLNRGPKPERVWYLGYDGNKGPINDTKNHWKDPIGLIVAANSVEDWVLWSWSGVVHPMHVHTVGFEIIERFNVNNPIDKWLPHPWETGIKDVAVVDQGEGVRLRMHFDIKGLFLWHCHNLAHEVHEMALPFCVGTCGVDCPVELCADETLESKEILGEERAGERN